MAEGMISKFTARGLFNILKYNKYANAEQIKAKKLA